jgi:serine/threonine protein kinase
VLTPAYASPEQILGDPCTISSDIYSLGAVLYELLTGVLPHGIEKCTPLALEQAICVDAVAPPSTVVRDRAVARRLKGDLDNIISRAMQKESSRRYESVEQMAEDPRRYLEHRPVSPGLVDLPDWEVRATKPLGGVAGDAGHFPR